MLSLIGSIFKYSSLVLVVLVLSHIIQIKGTTISRHVENGLNGITQFSPTRTVTRITREMSSAELDQVSEKDERELNQVIQKSRRR